MIKSLSFLYPTATAAEYQKLVSFLSALGFEAGRAWQQDTPEETSRGAFFLSPLGGIELIQGPMPPFAALTIEVTSIDSAHQAAAAWIRAEGLDPDSLLTPVADTDWKSRYFTVEPVPGNKFSFWAWDEARIDSLRGKPIAVEGDLSAAGMSFAIVLARWNAVITDRLLDGALDALVRSGAKRADIKIVRVPGAWEIPSAARVLAEQRSADAIITLGCLLRGETAHYEAIYNEVARGIGQSQQETGVPHSFGVLTCETLEQALNRAGIKAGNKGFEAAVAAIEMVNLHRMLLGTKVSAR